MWEFVKHSPWTFAIGGLILLGAIVGVIIGIVTKGGWKDRGFMRTDDGKYPLIWLKGNLPIIAMAHPDVSLAWRATFTAAASRINQAVGANLFDTVAQDPPPGYRLAGPVPAGFILLCASEPAGELQVDHGRTELKWTRSDGRIFAAVVTVPTKCVQRAAVMLHELGHVLGLEHDDNNLGSIMYHKLSDRTSPGQITEADAARLRRVYSCVMFMDSKGSGGGGGSRREEPPPLDDDDIPF